MFLSGIRFWHNIVRINQIGDSFLRFVLSVNVNDKQQILWKIIGENSGFLARNWLLDPVSKVCICSSLTRPFWAEKANNAELSFAWCKKEARIINLSCQLHALFRQEKWILRFRGKQPREGSVAYHNWVDIFLKSNQSIFSFP